MLKEPDSRSTELPPPVPLLWAVEQPTWVAEIIENPPPQMPDAIG
jgi:hypothetical protein